MQILNFISDYEWDRYWGFVIKELKASEQFDISVLPGSLSRRFSVKKENGLCRLKAWAEAFTLYLPLFPLSLGNKQGRS